MAMLKGNKFSSQIGDRGHLQETSIEQSKNGNHC
jgi:hypothetical protein